MPALPGASEPLALSGSTGGGGGSKRKGRGKGKKGKGKGQEGDDVPGTPKIRKRKGDEELLQLDLKRQRLVQRDNAVTRLQTSTPVLNCVRRKSWKSGERRLSNSWRRPVGVMLSQTTELWYTAGGPLSRLLHYRVCLRPSCLLHRRRSSWTSTMRMAI